MRRIITLIIIILLSVKLSADIPPTYASIGYTFSRSSMFDLNEWIELYNENPNKIGGYVFTHGYDKMHWLTGLYFGGGFRLSRDLELEVNFTRKFNHTFAYYDPANNPTYFRADIGIDITTVELAALYPQHFENITISTGFGMGFLNRKLLYWTDKVLMTAPTRKDMVKKNSAASVSFDPMIQFAFRPVKKLPIDIIARVYYQMMFTRMSVEWLGGIPGYWTAEEALTKKISGGNLGLTLALRLNISEIKLKRELDPIEELAYTPSSQIILSGIVTDAKTGLPIEAVISFYSNGKPVFSGVTENGKYTVSATPNATFTIETKAFGYQVKTENVTIPAVAEGGASYDIQLEKMAIGQVIKLENILFEKASANLLPESYIELDKLYRFLISSPTVKIEIAGHTSDEGDDKYNLKLSQDRSKSIANYLINKGISSNRIKAKGYGESNPVADNSSEEGRKLNRRVEFKILEM